MKDKLKYILLSIMLFLGLYISTLQAQETITATGGNANGSTGSVSYSIGQIFYIPIPGTACSVAPGVQQPYEISVVTAIDETEGLDLMISAYPNPANDFLVLKIDESALISYGSICYKLYDISGKPVKNENVVRDITQVHMNNLSPGIYMLKVFESYGTANQMEIKTFKIIKIK